MAKKSIIAREKKRAVLSKKYANLRQTYKKAAANPLLSGEERIQARNSLQALPRNANPTRKRNRCRLTGRSRGVYRKFGLGRSMLRIYAMKGEIPGLSKASW